MKFFDEVKALLTMDAVVRQYGYTPNRAGFLRCPFHDDKTPSMKLYRDGFHCFGCGAHGDAIDYVGRLFGMSPLEAAGRLNEDFHLGLSMSGEPPDSEGQRKREREKQARELFCAWRLQMLNQIDLAIRTANLANLDKLTDAETVAIRYRESFVYWSDLLMNGTDKQQMSVYHDREGVTRLCRMCLPKMQMRSSAALHYSEQTA